MLSVLQVLQLNASEKLTISLVLIQQNSFKNVRMKLVDRGQVDMKLCIRCMHFVLRMLTTQVNFESTLNDISFRSVNQAAIYIIL
jgi:hypothetical protein